MNARGAVAAGRDTPLGGGSVPVFPSLSLCLGGAFLWGLLMTACAFLSLRMEGRDENFHLAKLLAIYFAGGFFAWPVALPVARLLTRRRNIETRFAAHFASLSLCTIVMTAFFFAMDYRLFYAQWHQPFGTRVWIYQFIFTSIGATYQFLVMGLRLYLPVGLPLLAGASLWLALSMPRHMR
ncbi:hypothetical protein [Shinella sp. CPCC 101442]|uniref:hypothetical protein n=1 Tax=Shinella sp. CPCC 101442 TaxID=2932265 RepID=UPI0035B52DE2